MISKDTSYRVEQTYVEVVMFVQWDVDASLCSSNSVHFISFIVFFVSHLFMFHLGNVVQFLVVTQFLRYFSGQFSVLVGCFLHISHLSLFIICQLLELHTQCTIKICSMFFLVFCLSPFLILKKSSVWSLFHDTLVEVQCSVATDFSAPSLAFSIHTYSLYS